MSPADRAGAPDGRVWLITGASSGFGRALAGQTPRRQTPRG
jgi:NAD(P)-dependent dehydrogenase (short-subunit alcohol dehydrogenase family)